MRNEKLKQYLERERFSAEVQRQLIEKIKKDLIDLRMDVPVVLAVDSPIVGTTQCSVDCIRHVRTIQETILTLTCPSCKAAFFDFDGCATVTCSSCRKEFCGLCLDYFGGSDIVRLHVMECQRNPRPGNVFINSNELLTVHAAVRSDRIQRYFDEKLTNTETKENVLSIVRRDLRDLQIKAPDTTLQTRQVRNAIPNLRAPLNNPPPHRQYVRNEYAQQEALRLPVPPRPPPRRDCCIL